MSQWYYAHDGQQKGPVPISELQRLAANGEFDPESDLVWQEGLPDWKPASAVPELSSLSPNATPPPAEDAAAPTGPTPSPYETPRSPAPSSGAAPVAAAGGVPNQNMAIAAMICGIIALLTCFFSCLSLPLAIVAIVLGHLSISRIQREPERFTGKGFARVGQITGYLGLILTVLYTGFFFWVATRTPEQLEQMDWLPAEFSEQLQEELEKQRELQAP